jgi:NiFe hydrogenase small subunit HydA
MIISCEKCGQTIQINKKDENGGNQTIICPKCACLGESAASTKPPTLYWLQGGGCGGDTWSLFNSDAPNIAEMFTTLNIDVLWHPSISIESADHHKGLIDRILSGETPLDFLCVEGSIIRGPGGTGLFDTMFGKAKKDIIAALAKVANYVLAVGTCASFGGIGADGEIEATGMQFHKWDAGGFLGSRFRSRSDFPVINLPGCPCHCGVLIGTLSQLVSGIELELNEFQSPEEWYGTLVHQGCTRNEYHEYRVEEKKFGKKGCLFYYLGCHGPLVYGPCNKLLWNRRSSKTRVGVPCFGCTRPDFPQHYPFFETQNIEGIPLELPAGVDRAHYLAYKGIAAAAAPERLKHRKTGI